MVDIDVFSSLLTWEAEKYSRNSENGLLPRIFALIGATNKYYVSVGAGKSAKVANTAALAGQEWCGLLLGAEIGCDLSQRITRVSITIENINEIFGRYCVPDEPDLLLFDTGGNDYWLWNALECRYRPRVIVIEYNARVAPTESKAAPYDVALKRTVRNYGGASLLALTRLGEKKGYRLVYCDSSEVNAYFVRRDLLCGKAKPLHELFRPPVVCDDVEPYSGNVAEMRNVETHQITAIVVARKSDYRVAECCHALMPHVAAVVVINVSDCSQIAKLARRHASQVVACGSPMELSANVQSIANDAETEWLWFLESYEIPSLSLACAVSKATEDPGLHCEGIRFSYAIVDKTDTCTTRTRFDDLPQIVRRGYYSIEPGPGLGISFWGRIHDLPNGPTSGLPISVRDLFEMNYWQLVDGAYRNAMRKQVDSRGLNLPEAVHEILTPIRECLIRSSHRPSELPQIANAALRTLQTWLSHTHLIDDRTLAREWERQPKWLGLLSKVSKLVLNELAEIDCDTAGLSVVFKSPLWDSCGYATDGRAIAKALLNSRHDSHVEHLPLGMACDNAYDPDKSLLAPLLGPPRNPQYICITSCVVTVCSPDPAACYNVLRTTFETDRVPAYWLPLIETYDEVWVWSEANRAAFWRGGVPPEKLFVLPGYVDTDLFSAAGAVLPLPEVIRGRFVFLSVFDWQLRKGWDVLLKAYCSTFNVGDGVALLMKVSRSHGPSLPEVFAHIEEVLAAVNASLAIRPDIVVWDKILPETDMCKLYRSVDAYVVTSRGEGWGRSYLEAMASGLPTIATEGSGNADFMGPENSFLVQADPVDVSKEAGDEIHVFTGHQWMEPRFADVCRQLRAVFSDPQERAHRAALGMQQIRERYNLAQARDEFDQAVSRIKKKLMPTRQKAWDTRSVKVQLEGEIFSQHSFSKVNEILSMRLDESPHFTVSIPDRFMNRPLAEASPLAAHLKPLVDRELPGGPDVTIRHAYPPDFTSPAQGLWVHMQYWEYGPIPKAWLIPLRDRVDEIWASSTYMRNVYEQSGVAANKIQVIPLGVDTSVFTPNAPSLLIEGLREFVFVFVGGTLLRKGIDRVVEAYLNEFQAHEDVTLLIKDSGTQSFYQQENHRARVLALAAAEGAAHIAYSDEHLTEGQLASLYRAANCLVAPYRGEGFCLPVLEAMACGVPAIVTNGGPTNDFVTRDHGWLLPSQKVRSDHPVELCGQPAEFAIQLEDLMQCMREAYNDRQATRQKGELASTLAHSSFTWDRTIRLMSSRLQSLTGA